MKRVVIALIIFVTIFLTCDFVYATDNVILAVDKNAIKKGDVITLSVNIRDISVSALNMKLSFDTNKFDYVEGPEAINIIGNKILHVWYDETGGKTPKRNETIASFKFRAIENGDADFKIDGVFYNPYEKEIPVSFSNIRVNISDEVYEENNASDDNAYLEILRLGVEETSPAFNKTINEYIAIVDTSINSLNIMAIPENKDAEVEIIGNDNLKTGLNTIKINITSKDKSKKNTYTIRVTKTNNIQTANVNLESIEIENAILFPDFSNNITNYSANIPNKITKPKILALPEHTKATVLITGEDNLKIGDNKISITVTAEDKITKKAYIINAYRMTEEEETKLKKDQEEELKKSQGIIQKTSYFPEKADLATNVESHEIKKWNLIILILIGTVAVALVGYMWYLQIRKAGKL